MTLRLLLFATLASTSLWAQLAPSGLRCEYLTDPMGIDTPNPRFFWILQHAQRGASQTAYQIVVSGGNEVVWDSGRVASPESTHIAYAGKPLQSGKSYTWKVRYWDQANQASPYSANAHFDMGLLAASDWQAKWIRGGESGAQGVYFGCEAGTRASVRCRHRVLRTADQRPQGRRSRARFAIHALRQTRPLFDLRRHRHAACGGKRSRA